MIIYYMVNTILSGFCGKRFWEREGIVMAAHREDHGMHPSVVPPIGSLLVAEEYIIPQDLDFALEHQKHSKTLIGEILVRIGAVEPQELERVLTIQKKMTVR